MIARVENTEPRKVKLKCSKSIFQTFFLGTLKSLKIKYFTFLQHKNKSGERAIFTNWS